MDTQSRDRRYLWAQRCRDGADAETSKLITWMMETIDATRIHRRDLRAHFARKANDERSAAGNVNAVTLKQHTAEGESNHDYE
jgi:hypothetical protein